MKKVTLTLIIAFLYFTYSKAQNCNKIKSTFTSYSEAIRVINKTNFTLQQNINTPESSWIKSAYYRSCDRKKGFLLLYLKNSKIYIHQNLPTNIWNNFRTASSKGSYYTKGIKGRYRLIITK